MIVCIGMMIMLGGCGVHSVDDFCLLYIPVLTSDHDTPETLDQIDKNNALWLEFCQK